MLKDSLFWELRTSPGDCLPSIIFGTIHLSHPVAISKFERVKRYLDRYDRVYTESELGVTATSTIQPYIRMSASDSYKEYLTEKQVEKLSSIFCKACDFRLKDFLQLRPLFIQSILCMSLLNAGEEQVLDQLIWEYGISKGGTVQGIESTQEQIDILTSMSIETEYKQLIRLGKNITLYRKHLLQVVDAYRMERIRLLYKKSKSAFGFDKNLMLYDRNQVMSQRISNWHSEKPAFFSFGAGHLAGQKGVLNLLKLKGFNVKAIKE